MRSLERNKRPIHYALRIGSDEPSDAYGNPSGEVKPLYGAPQPLSIFVQDGLGSHTTQPYGSAAGCDKLLITTDMTLPIDVGTVFWVDTHDTAKPHDYVMDSPPVRGLNQVVYKLRRVEVTYA